MTRIVITQDFGKVQKLLAELGSKTVKQAVARSLKRTVRGMGTAANREFRSRRLIKLSAKAAKSRITERSRTGPTMKVASMFAELNISGRPESLARFYARRVYKGKSKLTGAALYGAKVTVFGKGTYIVNRGFILQKGKGAGMVILARLGEKRLPVEKQKGPSLGALAVAAGLDQKLASQAATRYQSELTHNLKYYAARAIAKAKGGGK